MGCHLRWCAVNVAAVTSERMHDYYVAREAEEVQIEALSGGRGQSEDLAATHFYRQTGAADLGGKEPLTMKVWMQQTTPPKPSPSELVDAAWVQAWEALMIAEHAETTLREARALRNGEVAALVAAGQTYGQIAHVLGITKQRVGQYVKAHREGKS